MSIQTSIIIPHYNNLSRLREVLRSVSRQCDTSVEVIVVDNSSPEQAAVKQQVEEFGALFLAENEFTNSPYSARNRGIERARGDVVVLLDASCVPEEGWLESGISCLDDSNVGVCSGNISYEVNVREAAAAELWDALTGVNARRAVERYKSAPGGNLFIRKSVFEVLGVFEEGIRSGGDFSFTNAASRKGLGLVYCPGANVFYPAKSLRSILSKADRVGRGQVGIWTSSGSFWRYFMKFPFKVLIPPRVGFINARIAELGWGSDISTSTLIQIFLVDWLVRVVQVRGNIAGLVGLHKK